jgi:hypothetical protein
VIWATRLEAGASVFDLRPNSKEGGGREKATFGKRKYPAGRKRFMIFMVINIGIKARGNGENIPVLFCPACTFDTIKGIVPSLKIILRANANSSGHRDIVPFLYLILCKKN